MGKSASARDGELLGWVRLPVPKVASVVWVAWTARGMRHCDWATDDAPAPAYCESLPCPSERPGVVADLARYLEGGALDPATLPVDPVGTPFQLRVWEALRNVRHGQVRTYAGIASDIGSPRAMRAVGQANGRNPVAIVIPCHRVVAAGNALGGYSGGLERKRFLLELEGVALTQEHVAPGQISLL